VGKARDRREDGELRGSSGAGCEDGSGLMQARDAATAAGAKL
jgi:hypothetical protein